MSKQLGKPIVRLLLALKEPLGKRRKELITASGVALCVLVLRFFGVLQSLEWAALDKFFQWRPHEQPEDNITIVAIDEPSLRSVGTWPIPDDTVAEVLQKLQVQQPRAIGLDIYRNLPVGPDDRKLLAAYKSMPNLIGIELLANDKNVSVQPPRLMKPNQVGFNNVMVDTDGKVRRSLLYFHDVNKQPHESFALKLALLYLKSEGIVPRPTSNREAFVLGKAVFHRFHPHDGAYVSADNRGYQILSNFPKPRCRNSSSRKSSCFRQVSLQDVLNNQVPKSSIKNRIVLIGSTAPSLQDFFLIPYSSRLMDRAKPVAGIQLQAHFISELISAARTGRPLIKVWSDSGECLWIFAWAYLGAAIRWRIRRPSRSFLGLLVCGLVLTGCAYVAFLDGWWIPIMPALLTFTGSATAITYQFAYMQEELKRSKEFLHQVINTIPDPIFVKNEKHQWIVLNDAYCQFIGHPKSLLLEKSDYDFFPTHEADVFRACDRLVFQTQQPQENEEEFTAASGKTYLIATKRSLHKDAAGNFYLVGVIRDITERKLREEKLRRTAAELSRSNNELKLQEDRLRYLAYHDALTGLPNRKFFAEQLPKSLEWARSQNLLLVLLFIDLDGFKKVNDTLGHEMGDRLLVTVAQRLNNCLRGSDTVSRLGGDEFTVILPAIPTLEVAAKVAEKILITITEPIVLDEHTTTVSASIGISVYPLNSKDCETLIKQADAAMYRAKHLGKNRFIFWD